MRNDRERAKTCETLEDLQLSSLVGSRLLQVPPNVKRIFPRVVPTQLLKSLVQCAVLIYDMHEADLEELEFVIQVVSRLSV